MGDYLTDYKFRANNIKCELSLRKYDTSSYAL